MQREEALKVQIATRSDPGSELAENNDCLGSLSTRYGDLLIVADGIGLTKAAGQGSRLVADAVIDFYRRWDGLQPRQMLVDAIGQANLAVREAIADNPDLEGMGATVAVLHYQKGMIRFAHVGNTRVYRQRSNVIDQMTNDHSEAQRLADAGKIPQDAVRNHPKAPILYRAVGSEAVLEVDLSDANYVQAGETYLLCTDGLYTMMDDAEIGRKARNMEPDQACLSLIHLANERGAADNLSLAIIKFTPTPHETKSFTDGVAGPPTIQRATTSRTLPGLRWETLTIWWKARLFALGLLLIWFLLLLLGWWLKGPSESAQAALWLPMIGAVLGNRQTGRGDRPRPRRPKQ